MDFNRVIYFLSDDEMFTGSQFYLDTLRSVVARPHGGPWLPQMDKLMTFDVNFDNPPAHLPDIMDVVAVPKVQRALDQTKVGDDADDDDFYGDVPTLLFPIVMADKADATPVLPSEGLVYWFGKRAFSTQLAFNSDAFQVLEITTLLTAVDVDITHQPLVEDYLNSRYYGITLTPAQSGNRNLDLGTTIVLWNARRITRPSFEKNFEKYVGMFKPAVIIFIEVRVHKICCKRVIKRLNTSLKWWIDGAFGLMGGTLVLWDPSKITFEMAEEPDTSHYDSRKRHLKGSIKAAVCGGASSSVEGGSSGGGDTSSSGGASVVTAV